MIFADFAAAEAPDTLPVSKHYPVLPFRMHLNGILRTDFYTLPAACAITVNKYRSAFKLPEERDPFLYKLN